jgi:hypothetical protein
MSQFFAGVSTIRKICSLKGFGSCEVYLSLLEEHLCLASLGFLKGADFLFNGNFNLPEDAEALKNRRIKASFNIGKERNYKYGDRTKAEEWIDQAIRFWEDRMRKGA